MCGWKALSLTEFDSADKFLGRAQTNWHSTKIEYTIYFGDIFCECFLWFCAAQQCSLNVQRRSALQQNLTRNKSMDVLIKWKTAQRFTTNIGKVNSFLERVREQRLTTFWFICTKVKWKIYFYWICADSIHLNGDRVSE